MAGRQRFLAGFREAGAAVRRFGVEAELAGRRMTSTTKRTWLMNQALFTMRRLAYGVTLGIVGLGALLIKWGFDFNRQMQDARVGLEGFLPNTQAINAELQEMYYLAAITPFSFPDILLGTRRLIPFTENVQQANDLMEALTNSLSAVGQASGQNLTRVTIAAAHLLAIGRVTGYQLNQFSRDNIQLTKMLAYHYNTTTAEITRMVHEGMIPAEEAVKAIIGYQKTAGFEGKNFALATKTLTGAWTTFQDILRAASGREQQGLFEALRKKLYAIDLAMLPLIQGNKPVTISMIALAMNSQLTPATNALWFAFQLAKGFLQGLIGTFVVLFKIITFITQPLGFVGDQVRILGYLFRLLGILIGINLARLIIYNTVLYASAIIMILYNAVKKRQIYLEKAAAIWLGIVTVVQNLYTVAVTGSIRAQGGHFRALTLTEKAVYRLRLATLALTAAMLTNPITLIIAAAALLIVGLVILYFKWERFRNAVNSFAAWIYDHWYLLAFIPIFGPLAILIIKIVDHFETLVGWVKTFIGWAKTAWDWIVKIASWSPHGLLFRALKWGAGLVGLQHGGVVNTGGAFMVGEAGPEVVHLPRGAAVQPNVGAGGIGADALSLTIEPAPVYVDGLKIAEVVFKHYNDRVARS